MPRPLTLSLSPTGERERGRQAYTSPLPGGGEVGFGAERRRRVRRQRRFHLKRTGLNAEAGRLTGRAVARLKRHLGALGRIVERLAAERLGKIVLAGEGFGLVMVLSASSESK